MSGGELFAGTVEGVRAWNLSDDLELRGRGLGEEIGWAAGGQPTEATCLHSPHAAPEPSCSCGLYALHPQANHSRWLRSILSAGVAGVVEAWGRIELHEVGFRAQFARPKLLFEPANHLISAEALARLRDVAERYDVPVVPLPTSAHAGEWCRTRGMGLARQLVEDLVIRDFRIFLRRGTRVTDDGRWLTVGLWPEVREPPDSDGAWELRTGLPNELPGVRTCRVRIRGEDAARVFHSEEFDPGRKLRLIGRSTWDYEGVDVWSLGGELRLGALSSRTAREVGPRLRAGRIAEVRSLTRTVGLRDDSRRNGWLTLLIAPDIPIEAEPVPTEPPRLHGFDWARSEPRLIP